MNQRGNTVDYEGATSGPSARLIPPLPRRRERAGERVAAIGEGRGEGATTATTLTTQEPMQQLDGLEDQNHVRETSIAIARGGIDGERLEESFKYSPG
jgi:hypothetical protein